MITILPLLESQIPLMVSVAHAAHSYPMSENTISSCFGKFYTSLGIYVNQELVGFIILYQVFEEASIMDICIAPKCQGQGLGQQLLRYAISALTATDAQVLLLEVRASNHHAIALYKKLGFITTGSRKNYYKTDKGSEDAILMILTMDNSADKNH